MRQAIAVHPDIGAAACSAGRSWKRPWFAVCPAPPVPLLLRVAQLRPLRFTLRSPGSVELTS